MEETLKAIQQQLVSMAAVNDVIVARLDTLEDKEKPQASIDNKDQVLGGEAGKEAMFLAGGKEKSLSLTFGDGECSAREQFLKNN